ncbi:MAG: two-component regulator propeller domain-containing protein [Fulvivirga sp.]
MKYLFIFFFFLTIAAHHNVSGQHYYFRHYQAEDGLSHNSVTCMLQDKDGFLWIGTKDGLNRFDGYSFKVFRHDPADSTSIGGNFVQSLYEDAGYLWVGTNNGLYKYNPRSEDFIFIKGTENRHIKDVVKAENGNLWFIAGFTIAKYNEQKDALKYYDVPQYISATSACETVDGNMWFSSISGTIARYDSIRDEFITYNVFENSPETTSQWVERVYTADESTILIGTQSQGVKSFDLNTYTYKDILTKDPEGAEIFVRDFLVKSEEEYWIATESGIYIYNLADEEVVNLRKNNNNPYSISDNAVYTLCHDREGGVWAGTYFGGLSYYAKQYTPFEKYFPIGNENSISGNAVREIVKDENNNLWIGTEDAGLNKFNPSTGRFAHFKADGSEGSLSYHNIHGLLAHGDELWVGTFEHGLDVMDIHTGKVIRHYSAGNENKKLRSNFFHTLHKTRSGEIFAGTSVGLYSYNPESDDFSPVPGFPFHHYTYILDDHEGKLWAGTLRDGLFCFDPRTNSVTYYDHDFSDVNSLASDYLASIFEDSNNDIWVATEGGLCKYLPETNNFKRYSAANGLPSNVIYSLLEDDDKNLWIGTSKGLVTFNLETENIKIFTKANGLVGDQLNYNSAYKDQDGQMYFGGVKGMISFHPSRFMNNDYIPPIHITGFQVKNKELPVNNESPLQQSITYTDKVTLDHDQSSFSIDFAALSFTAPPMAEYGFKMEGLDSDWTYLKANRKAYFTDLGPGNYTFKVKASNSSGVWNEEAAQLHIIILPPFWASPWAYILYLSLGLALGFYGVKNYHHKTEQKNKRKIKILENEKEKEIYQAKIEFFTNVAHEIRTPLTLIKGPLEKIIKIPIDEPVVTSNLLVIEKNTQRLLNLTNQLLDFRKTEAKGFSLTFIKANINELLTEICAMFNAVAAEKNLYIINDLPSHPVHAYVDREAFTKIVTNLVNNAVKYADSTLIIRVKTSAENENVIISVENDGAKIPLEMKEKIFEPLFRLDEADGRTGSGIGLSLARSLTELHNGHLELNSTTDDLNTFVLTLPVHQKNEFKFYNDDAEKDVLKEELEIHDNNEGKPVLLLVEDSRELLQFIADEFNHGYNVITAVNGAEAFARLKDHNVQLVISDVVMPIMDGFELCHKIKTTIDYSHIPIILLTAKNTVQAKIEGLETGADAYIEKPFSPDHLQVQVSNLLSNRNKIKEYFSSSPLTHIRSIAYTKADEQFLKRLNEVIQENLSDTELNVDLLADFMSMSRPTFYRKIKAISNLTPNELINIARLKTAAELLAQGDYKVYEVADIVGYNSQSSFGRNFQKQFGMAPSEYASGVKNEAGKNAH